MYLKVDIREKKLIPLLEHYNEEYDIHINELTFEIQNKDKTIYSNIVPLDSNVEYDFAKDCEYISNELYQELVNETLAIGKMLGSMINNPYPFLIKPKK